MARALRAEVVVHFNQLVDGPGELGQPCQAARHRFVADAVVPRVDETLFLQGDEIVHRWPTATIARVEWFRPGRGDGAYTLAAKRQNHPKAYERWGEEEDDQLRAEHAAGMTLSEMSAAHGRNPGAITSRLQRLGLMAATPDTEAEGSNDA
jgi:hypothetical protein